MTPSTHLCFPKQLPVPRSLDHPLRLSWVADQLNHGPILVAQAEAQVLSPAAVVPTLNPAKSLDQAHGRV